MFKTLRIFRNKILQNKTHKFFSEDQGFFSYNNKLVRKSDQPSGQVLEQKGQILHTSNLLKDDQITQALSEQSYSVAETTQQNKEAILLTLKENANIALIANKPNEQRTSIQQISNIQNIQGSLKLKINPQNVNGAIIDHNGVILSEQQQQLEENNSESVELPIFRRNKQDFKRTKNDQQIFTGNMAVDFSKPIARGHYTMLKGAPRSGKSYFMVQTMIQHLKQSQQHFHGYKSNGVYAIYVSLDYQNATKAQQLLQEADVDNYTIYSQKSGDLADNFFLPFSALAHANYIRKTQNKEVVLMFDDVYDHFFNELNIYTEAEQPFSPLQILKEVYTCTGNFKNQGSLTSFISFDSDAFKVELTKEATALENDAESLVDNIINFDLKEALTIPKLNYKVKSTVFNEIHQNVLHHSLQCALQSILKELSEQKHTSNMSRQLGIQVDPWDCYLLHDSKYFMKLLINNAYYTPIEQIVLMGFTIRAVNTETVSQFKDNSKQLLQQLFEFCEDFRDFEDDANIFEYIEVLLQRQQPEMVLQHIERIYELFIMHLKMNDKLHQFKKDYLV